MGEIGKMTAEERKHFSGEERIAQVWGPVGSEDWLGAIPAGVRKPAALGRLGARRGLVRRPTNLSGRIRSSLGLSGPVQGGSL